MIIPKREVFAVKNMFPMMLDQPEDRCIAAGIPYWIFAFFFFPALISLSTLGSRGQSYEAWIEIAYHLINFLCVLFFFLPYLKESFLTARDTAKNVLVTAVDCASAIVVLKYTTFIVCSLSGNLVFEEAAFGSLLTTEADLLYYSTGLISEQPLWGTLCLTIPVPIVISCLYYACVFAPVCVKRPWLAYLLIAVLPLLPRLSLVFCLWPLETEMAVYLLQLPVHLIACWSYQKTDTVWTPIAVHIISNLVLALISLVNMGIL